MALDVDGEILRVEQSDHALRRPHRRQRSVLRRRAARHHRADRPERRRQDHRVQLHHRLLQADRGRIALAHGARPPDDCALTRAAAVDARRRRAFLLERMPDFRIARDARVARTFQNIRLFAGMTRAGKPAGRAAQRADAASGYHLARPVRPRQLRARRERGDRQARASGSTRIGLARPRRRPRRRPALWRAAAARNRPRHVHRAGAALPRRAGRRAEPARNRGELNELLLTIRDDARHLHPADRARHGRGDGHLRPHRGAGLRRARSPKARRPKSAPTRA